MIIQSVILAGGLSTRLGQNKMLLPINGKTVIEYCIEAFLLYCSKIIVVTGKYDKEIRAVLGQYPKVSCVYNPNYEQGMFSSVKSGIEKVDSQRFFITPGDYPLLQSSTILSLLQMQSDLVKPVYHGISGHPILLDQSLTPLILKSGSSNLRQCLNSLTIKCRNIDVDDKGVITDLDTIDDYYAILKKFI